MTDSNSTFNTFTDDAIFPDAVYTLSGSLVMELDGEPQVHDYIIFAFDVSGVCESDECGKRHKATMTYAVPAVAARAMAEGVLQMTVHHAGSEWTAHKEFTVDGKDGAS